MKELVLAALLLSARDVLGGLDYVASIKDVADHAKIIKDGPAERMVCLVTTTCAAPMGVDAIQCRGRR